MGGIKKYMPITYWTMLIGSLALIGFPGFAGFFSKDAIIEAVHLSHTPGAGFAYFSVLIGVFITAFYSFRMFFLVFHGEERMDEHTRVHLHETPWVVTGPLIALAIPSIFIGAIYIGPMLFGDFFRGAIFVSHERDVLGHLGEHFHGWFSFVLHGLAGPAFYLAMAGVGAAWFLYMKRPDIAEMIKDRSGVLYTILDRKYGFDDFNDKVIAAGSRGLGRLLWQVGDVKIIDGFIVNGAARSVGWFSSVIKYVQTGFLYHYAFAMFVGLFALIALFVF
ncbi:MAG TPA: NADH-quinone oxidoreductase subunit L, partial [Gammaproteobacteria bacterium]|nr:NADH-quinone oxidoreductase subunit L [Gammaproteobacteria bacterium]